MLPAAHSQNHEGPLRVCLLAMNPGQMEPQNPHKHKDPTFWLEGPRQGGSRNMVCRILMLLNYTILYYTILYYTILYYTILYYTILYYTILYYTILYYTILYYTILYYTILYYTILYYTVCRILMFLLSFGPLDKRLLLAGQRACAELHTVRIVATARVESLMHVLDR